MKEKIIVLCVAAVQMIFALSSKDPEVVFLCAVYLMIAIGVIFYAVQVAEFFERKGTIRAIPIVCPTPPFAVKIVGWVFLLFPFALYFLFKTN